MPAVTQINGITELVPLLGDKNWGQYTSKFLLDIAQYTYQPNSGSTLALSVDLNYGANFGVISTYFKSRSNNIAQSGILRLSNTDFIAFRNFANNADLALSVNTSDKLTFNGSVVGSSATNGLLAQITPGNIVGRTLQAGTGISITNPDGIAGNPSITAFPTGGNYEVQFSDTGQFNGSAWFNWYQTFVPSGFGSNVPSLVLGVDSTATPAAIVGASYSGILTASLLAVVGSTAANGTGGSVLITGGLGSLGQGSVTVQGATSSNATAPGHVNITGGLKSSGAGSASDVNITGGLISTGSSSGGAVNINGGFGNTGSSSGGAVNINGGLGAVANGAVNINTPVLGGNAAVNINYSAGVSGVTFQPGSITLGGSQQFIVGGSSGTTGQVLTSTGGNIGWSTIGSTTNRQTIAPTAGSSNTITSTATGIIVYVVNPAGTLASLTINMPVTPIDGQQVVICFRQAISAAGLLINPSGGHSIDNPPTSAAQYSSLRYAYDSSLTTWVSA